MNFGQNVLGAGTVVQSAVVAAGAVLAAPQAAREPIPEIAAGWESGRSPAVTSIPELRSKTPNRKARSAVNPPGAKVDPVYGYPVASYDADHIVPFNEILQMPGFLTLSMERQVEVLNLPDNFMGLGRATNASKQDMSWAEWPGHSQLGPVSPLVRSQMVTEAARIKVQLQQAINERLGQ